MHPSPAKAAADVNIDALLVRLWIYVTLVDDVVIDFL
jgi:hypothetical protein